VFHFTTRACAVSAQHSEQASISSSNSVWHHACPVIRRRTKPAPDFSENSHATFGTARGHRTGGIDHGTPDPGAHIDDAAAEARHRSPAIVAYFQSIPADKQEIALVHALEVGVTELGVRRGKVKRA